MSISDIFCVYHQLAKFASWLEKDDYIQNRLLSRLLNTQHPSNHALLILHSRYFRENLQQIALEFPAPSCETYFRLLTCKKTPSRTLYSTSITRTFKLAKGARSQLMEIFLVVDALAGHLRAMPGSDSFSSEVWRGLTWIFLKWMFFMVMDSPATVIIFKYPR